MNLYELFRKESLTFRIRSLRDFFWEDRSGWARLSNSFCILGQLKLRSRPFSLSQIFMPVVR